MGFYPPGCEWCGGHSRAFGVAESGICRPGAIAAAAAGWVGGYNGRESKP